jgi:hypothetical protein
MATVAFFALSIPYAVAPSRRLLSLAQLYAALIANYGLFLRLSSLRSRTVSRLFLSVAVQVYFGIPFVDAIRSGDSPEVLR